MSLPNYLAKIKSSGIYRFVWDKSEVAGVPAETLRLVVGYSEKGPFNTPTYIQSASEFIQIYGNINKKLERRGVYFHRLALQALTAGPILALNLKKFENEKVEAISFAPDKSMFKVNDTSFTNPNIISLDIEDVYDTNRFWVLDANKMQNKTENYITLSATDSKECSNTVFMRSANVQGYNLSAQEWYSTATTDEMPSYFEGYENLKIEDFFAEVYVFRGKFTKELASSKEMSKYFNIAEDGTVSLKRYLTNAFGEKIDTLEALSQNENANFVKRYEGILLPNFKDSNNNYISLDLLFNSDNYEHKMLMDFNIEKLDDGDISIDSLITTGYNKEINIDELVSALGTEDYEKCLTGVSLFSNANVVPEISYAQYNEDWEYTNSDFVKEPHLYVYDINSEDLNNIDYVKYSSVLLPGDRFLGVDGKIATLTEIKEVKEISEESDSELEKLDESTLVKNENSLKTQVVYALPEVLTVGQPNAMIGGIEVAENDKDKKVLLVIDTKGDKLFYYSAWNDKYEEPIMIDGKYYFGAHGTGQIGFPLDTVKGSATELQNIHFQIIPNSNSINTSFEIIEITDDVYNLAYKKENLETNLNTFNTVISQQDIIESVTNYKCKLIFDNDANTFEDKYLVKYNTSLGADCSMMIPTYLEGYTYENSKPTSMKQIDKLNWQNFILSALTEYRGIRTALTSRQDIDYRYIVDTFEGFVDSECKSKIAIIAKEKDNALAFLNFPSVYNFTTCDYTSFTDEKNRFQVKYIKEGGNKIKNPSVLFSLVSEANGASYVSYNTPLTFTDGTVKTYVPSAALVSNNFMQKYTSRQPYYIVAGPNYGRIVFDGCVGPDYNFSRADLDILEPMGVNAMVFVPRIGTYINSNQTAKQNPVTALSKVHVRELVIFLQDEIEALLQKYQWEFNTQQLRDTVKAKADTICENIRANGGIYAFVNRCDDSNNNSDVIDNEMFVLSTEIEPGRGAGKMVQELTIHKTGGLTSVIR